MTLFPLLRRLVREFFLVYKRFSGIFELGEIAYGNAWREGGREGGGCRVMECDLGWSGWGFFVPRPFFSFEISESYYLGRGVS